MARILVTGGAGYLGSHTVAELRRAGHQALVYDNLSNGHRQALDPDVAVVVGDIDDARRLAAALDRWRPAAVIHLAATPGYDPSLDPSRCYRTDLMGTIELLDLLVPGQVPVVACSTSEVHGAPWRLPVDELTPVMPVTLRARVSAEVERALETYDRAHGLRSVVVRVSELAGADPSGRIGPAAKAAPSLESAAWAAALRRGPEVVIRGDAHPTRGGTCQRDFVHVRDAAAALVAAADSLLDGGWSAVYGVGTGIPSSVHDVLAAVAGASGRPVPHRVGDPRPGEAPALWVDSGRIRAALGWSPRYGSLREIVSTSTCWHVEHQGGYSQRPVLSLGTHATPPEHRDLALVSRHESEMAAALGGLAHATQPPAPKHRLVPIRRLGRRVRPEGPGPSQRDNPEAGSEERHRAG